MNYVLIERALIQKKGFKMYNSNKQNLKEKMNLERGLFDQTTLSLM
jgi:hypothetical protein